MLLNVAVSHIFSLFFKLAQIKLTFMFITLQQFSYKLLIVKDIKNSFHLLFHRSTNLLFILCSYEKLEKFSIIYLYWRSDESDVLFPLGSDPLISCHSLGPMICADSELKVSSNVLPPSVPENKSPGKLSVDIIKDK